MEAEDLERRVERLEEQLRALREELDSAQGEAWFAGQLAPMLLTVMTKAGLLPRERAREFLDHLLLLMERSQGSFPGQQKAFEHVRSRIEATLRPFVALPPGHG